LETERTVVVADPVGLHARPAAVFAQTASKFQATVEVLAKGRKVNAKSLLSLLTLGVTQGESVTIRATGLEACAAVNALAAVLETPQ
jgi:phosphocarrier protein HPr